MIWFDIKSVHIKASNTAMETATQGWRRTGAGGGRGCTCEQHRPLDLEGKGEQDAEAHSVSCRNKDLGIWHSRIVLEGWNCLLPGPQGKVPAAAHSKSHPSERGVSR